VLTAECRRNHTSRARSGRSGDRAGDAVATFAWNSQPLRCTSRSLHRCRPTTRSTSASSPSDRLRHQPRRGPDRLRRRLARAAARRAGAALPNVEHFVVMGDGRSASCRARSATRASRRGGRRRLTTTLDRRAPGAAALLHDRHDRRAQGRLYFAPLDCAPLGGALMTDAISLRRADRGLLVVPMFHVNAWAGRTQRAQRDDAPDARPFLQPSHCTHDRVRAGQRDACVPYDLPTSCARRTSTTPTCARCGWRSAAARQCRSRSRSLCRAPRRELLHAWE